MLRKGPTSNFAIVFSVADDLFSLCLNMQLAYAKYRTLSPIFAPYHHQWCKSSGRKCFTMSADCIQNTAQILACTEGYWAIQHLKHKGMPWTVDCMWKLSRTSILGTSLQHTCYIFLITGDSCQLNQSDMMRWWKLNSSSVTHLPTFIFHIQWRIQDFLDGRVPNPDFGAKTIIWQGFCRKLHVNERYWTDRPKGRGRAQHTAPPPHPPMLFYTSSYHILFVTKQEEVRVQCKRL